MPSLTEELLKTEYDGLSPEQILPLVKDLTYTHVGKITHGETLHLVSMLARGLRARINNCQSPELKIAWDEALNPAYLASPSYSINVGLPDIRAMLDIGKLAGVCTQDEYDFIIQLATKTYPTFPDVSLKDIIAIKQPQKLSDGSYISVQGKGSSILLTLLETLPEACNVRVEMRESLDGVNYTQWNRVTHFYNVKDVGIYKTDWQGSRLPFVELRIKNELYNMSATAQAV